MLVSSAVELLYQISPANVQCRPVKILLALMTVLIGPLSLITLQVSINNIIVNIRTREGNITTNGLHKERVKHGRTVSQYSVKILEKNVSKSQLSKFQTMKT